MTDIIKDPNDICGWLDNLANLKADELNHPATLDGLREIGRDAKAEIERLRAALRVLADLDNWDDIGHWMGAWDLGTPWEFARAALEEKE